MGLAAAIAVVSPVSPVDAATDVASYEMEVVLHEAEGRLDGVQRLEWRNTTGVAAHELHFHLYLNGFAHPDTTFMRGYRERRPPRTVERWGWIRWTRLETEDGLDLLGAVEYVRPDDGNPADFTVARVPLPVPVAPGETIRLASSFEAVLPEIVARTGVADGLHLVAQWFPKLGVFEGADGWSCHQFHAATEFHADFGRYLVTVDVPWEWVVAAAGLERSRQGHGDRQRVTFEAGPVHDFVWATAPADRLQVVEERFEPHRDVPPEWLAEAARLLGRSTAELELAPVRIRLAIPPAQRRLVPRMLRAARLSLAWSGLRFGPYPYPQLTILSPPPEAVEAGGMEYPTFFTTGADPVERIPPFSWAGGIESVTAHEHAHQYVPGLVSTDEAGQAWVDEGFATWVEAETMAAMARIGALPAVHADVGRWQTYRLWGRLGDGRRLVVDRPAWRFRTLGEYGRASYGSAAIGLATAEALVGREAFARGLRSFVERHRYGHASGDDLVRALSEAAGTDLGPFFEQAYRAAAVVDWTVLDVRPPARADEPRGYRFRDGRWVEAAATDDAPASSGWSVDLGRADPAGAPLEVEITYADGGRERRTWGGESRWTRWQLEPGRDPVAVVADPDGAWLAEVRRRDNVWRAEPEPGEARRRLWWLAAVVHLLLGAVG